MKTTATPLLFSSLYARTDLAMASVVMCESRIVSLAPGKLMIWQALADLLTVVMPAMSVTMVLPRSFFMNRSRSCRTRLFSRSTLNCEPMPLPERKLKLELEIVRVSQAHPKLGNKKIARKLMKLGYCVNKNRCSGLGEKKACMLPKPR